ncbi:hypothetical protein Trydic_g4050 [Trypoxylus dichotomus]
MITFCGLRHAPNSRRAARIPYQFGVVRSERDGSRFSGGEIIIHTAVSIFLPSQRIKPPIPNHTARKKGPSVFGGGKGVAHPIARGSRRGQRRREEAPPLPSRRPLCFLSNLSGNVVA